MNAAALKEIFLDKPIDALTELAAYEFLWTQPKASVKTMADLFRQNPGMLPSDLVDENSIHDTLKQVQDRLSQAQIESFGLFINGTFDYPEQLQKAKHPIEVAYFRGDWSLAEDKKLIAVVGSRKVTEEGARRTRKLVHQLVEAGYTIVSGMAEGVDTAAHTAAIEAGGKTIAVTGTPVTEVYPKSNQSLHDEIVENHLLISQVPILKYYQQDWRINRGFFPERNKTMSALTKASIIVEAGETSGTLIQARAAFYQGKELFILNSCFLNESISWPERFHKNGAHRVTDINDILAVLDTIE
jgi:DNA processing protein